MKKAFSLIELLFVMVILSSLAAIALPNMKSSEEAAALTVMKSDAKNIINLLYTQNVNSNFNNILSSNISGSANDKGLLFLSNGASISLSKENKIEYLLSEGNIIGSCNQEGQGFYFIISNQKIPNKFISFNSCLDNQIRVTELNQTEINSISTGVITSTVDTSTINTTTTETTTITSVISHKNYKNNRDKNK